MRRAAFALALALVASLVVLSAGPAFDRRTGASVSGLDAELGGAFTIAPGFEARLTAYGPRP